MEGRIIRFVALASKTLCGLLAMAFVSTNANASVIYQFDVSDVSWASSVSGDTSGAMLTFEFADGADLNALVNGDLLSMGFASSIGSWTSIAPISGIFPNDFFSISSGVAALTVGATDKNASITSIGAGGYMQVGQTVPLLYGPAHIALHNGSEYILVFGPSGSHTYYSTSQSTSVPEPSAFALLGLGLAGMGMVRRRKTH